MPDPARQLVLDLPPATRFGIEDFLVGPTNEAAFAAIDAWPDWPDRLLHLRGPEGSGKSHLSAIWAARAGARTVVASAVSGPGGRDLAGSPLLIEDVDRGPLDEPALFHLINMARESRDDLLLTSAAPPELCGIGTPDLLSRLRLAPSVVIGPPDDALLKAVLVKLFADRQALIDTSVIDYVATRIERSFASAAAIVAEIDGEALSQGRRVTRPIAAAILARHRDVAD